MAEIHGEIPVSDELNELIHELEEPQRRHQANRSNQKASALTDVLIIVGRRELQARNEGR